MSGNRLNFSGRRREMVEALKGHDIPPEGF